MLSLGSKLNELNPQFLREIKGRLTTRNLWLAGSISLLGQLMLFLYFQTRLPPSIVKLPHNNTYCTGKIAYGDYGYNTPECIMDNYGNIIINWQLWSQDIFHALSWLGIFAIIVVGTYLLINDLATEQRRDTLNFIRLSPQTPQNILVGKMLGVPILLYVTILMSFPFHLWAGLNAKLPLNQILVFDVIVLVASVFYYSGALLFGFIASWLGGFQSWLGGGFILGFLLFTEQALKHTTVVNTPLVLFRLITPTYFIPDVSGNQAFTGFHWFSLPLGNQLFTISSLSLLLYCIGIYFIWQSLQRCYLDANATMSSKRQSYLLTTSFVIITLGCGNWHDASLKDYLVSSMFVYLWLFLYLIAALTQNRQTLINWARYHHIYSMQHPRKQKFVKELIWGEKSPGVLAIAINALIVFTGLTVVLLLQFVSVSDMLSGFGALIFALSLMVIYAALAQLLLFMKNGQRLLWANGMVTAVIILPPILLSMLFSSPQHLTFVWFLSIFAPILFLYPPTNDSLSLMTPLLAMLAHAGTLGLLLLQIKRQLQKAGD